MKKLRILLTGLFLFVATGACADNERPISVNQLPQPAQQFIRQHFSDRKIALVKMETDFMKKSYDVLFADGSQIEFDSQGNWKEVDCKLTEIPAAILPTPISTYITSNYPGVSAVKIEKDRREYEVKLSNRIELTFDRQYNLIDIDR